MHHAGIRRIVIVGNESLHLCEAEHVLARLGRTFSEITFYQDPGLGVHGLPYQARAFLEDVFVFECGHSIMHPQHYRDLDAVKNSDNVIFSAFVPHPSNLRQPVRLEAGKIELASRPAGQYAVAHPLLIDNDYVDNLAFLGFEISRIIDHYARRGELGYVLSSMPPEFDVAQELEASTEVYRAYLSNSKLGVAADSLL
jgi:hypothetical protein